MILLMWSADPSSTYFLVLISPALTSPLYHRITILPCLRINVLYFSIAYQTVELIGQLSTADVQPDKERQSGSSGYEDTQDSTAAEELDPCTAQLIVAHLREVYHVLQNANWMIVSD